MKEGRFSVGRKLAGWLKKTGRGGEERLRGGREIWERMGDGRCEIGEGKQIVSGKVRLGRWEGSEEEMRGVVRKNGVDGT